MNEDVNSPTIEQRSLSRRYPNFPLFVSTVILTGFYIINQLLILMGTMIFINSPVTSTIYGFFGYNETRRRITPILLCRNIIDCGYLFCHLVKQYQHVESFVSIPYTNISGEKCSYTFNDVIMDIWNPRISKIAITTLLISFVLIILWMIFYGITLINKCRGMITLLTYYISNWLYLLSRSMIILFICIVTVTVIWQSGNLGHDLHYYLLVHQSTLLISCFIESLVTVWNFVSL